MQTEHYGFFLHNPAGTLSPGNFGHNMLARQIDEALYGEEQARIADVNNEKDGRKNMDSMLKARCDGLERRIEEIEAWIAGHDPQVLEGADTNAD